MSNHLPHFADKGRQLLNLTGYRVGNLEQKPCQSAWKVQIENCESAGTNRHGGGGESPLHSKA